MQNSEDKLSQLLELYVHNSCSKQELHDLLQLLDSSSEEAIRHIFYQQWTKNEAFSGIPDAQKKLEHMLESLHQVAPISELKSAASSLSDSQPPSHCVHLLKTGWFRYAAVFLLIAGTITFLYQTLNKPPQATVKNKSSEPSDIQPGGNKATLTLSDGSTIVLDNAANGSLTRQGTTRIVKLGDGKLAYQAGASNGEQLYNTISTPNGGQYQITLPDGSKVWLNALSSIRFPTTFATQRTVVITGEVYLEVVNDRKRPFFVEARDERIEILGTSFNVNAYHNEPVIVTTLLSGSVQIGKTLLKPGEAYANGKKYKADVARATAWKNGFFNFEDATLVEVMRELERWYDIEVSYAKGVPATRFGGEINKQNSLQDVLQILEKSNIHFRLEEGRKLVVKP